MVTEHRLVGDATPELCEGFGVTSEFLLPTLLGEPVLRRYVTHRQVDDFVREVELNGEVARGNHLQQAFNLTAHCRFVGSLDYLPVARIGEVLFNRAAGGGEADLKSDVRGDDSAGPEATEDLV